MNVLKSVRLSITVSNRSTTHSCIVVVPCMALMFSLTISILEPVTHSVAQRSIKYKKNLAKIKKRKLQA